MKCVCVCMVCVCLCMVCVCLCVCVCVCVCVYLSQCAVLLGESVVPAAGPPDEGRVLGAPQQGVMATHGNGC